MDARFKQFGRRYDVKSRSVGEKAVRVEESEDIKIQSTPKRLRLPRAPVESLPLNLQNANAIAALSMRALKSQAEAPHGEKMDALQRAADEASVPISKLKRHMERVRSGQLFRPRVQLSVVPRMNNLSIWIHRVLQHQKGELTIRELVSMIARDSSGECCPSIATVWRMMKNNGWTFKPQRIRPQLSDEQKQQRVTWAETKLRSCRCITK